MGAQAMRKSEQESQTEEQYEVRWRLDKDAAKGEDRGEVDSGVRNADGDGTVGLISSGAHFSRTPHPSRHGAAPLEEDSCSEVINSMPCHSMPQHLDAWLCRHHVLQALARQAAQSLGLPRGVPRVPARACGHVQRSQVRQPISLPQRRLTDHSPAKLHLSLLSRDAPAVMFVMQRTRHHGQLCHAMNSH